MESARSVPIRAVVFDVGEVLIDESNEYGTWADWLGVPRHTFSAMFGAVIARGEDYRQVFEHFKPGFDLAAERQRRLDAGLGEFFNSRDLYPDARGCLAELKHQGYVVGIAGNQTSRAGQFLRELHLDADFVFTSDDLGAEKPSVDFFEKIVEEVGLDPPQLLYVGDRLENDVLPARKAGLATALLLRGPWGFVNATKSEAAVADLRLGSLGELPSSLAALNATRIH